MEVNLCYQDAINMYKLAYLGALSDQSLQDQPGQSPLLCNSVLLGYPHSSLQCHSYYSGSVSVDTHHHYHYSLPVAGNQFAVAGNCPGLVGNCPGLVGNCPAVVGNCPAVAGHSPVVSGNGTAVAVDTGVGTGRGSVSVQNYGEGDVCRSCDQKYHHVFFFLNSMYIRKRKCNNKYCKPTVITKLGL